MATEGRIVDYAEYGQHIPLRCKKHPDKRWSTKNIAPIGCRKICYNLYSVEGMGPECDCPLSDLEALAWDELTPKDIGR